MWAQNSRGQDPVSSSWAQNILYLPLATFVSGHFGICRFTDLELKVRIRAGFHALAVHNMFYFSRVNYLLKIYEFSANIWCTVVGRKHLPVGFNRLQCTALTPDGRASIQHA
jgi:hypothetical protein